MLYIGIDFGKISGLAVINGREVIHISRVRKEKLKDIVMGIEESIVAIDSPLSLPKNFFRSCDKELLKRGIPCLSPKIFIKTVLDAIELAKSLKMRHEVIEVYPYATRVVLNIAPKAKKNTVSGRKEIQNALGNFINNIPKKILSSDEIDAIICALTAYLKSENLCEEIVCEEGGAIYIPSIKATKIFKK